MLRRLACAIVLLAVTAGAAAAEPVNVVARRAFSEVCRPASERSIPPRDLAERAGYVAQERLPEGIAESTPFSRAWRAPSDSGEVYVVSTVLMPPATPFSCLVAVYDSTPVLFDMIFPELAAAGFKPNFQMTRDTPTARMFKMDRSAKSAVDAVLGVAFLTKPKAGPTATLLAYRVDEASTRAAGGAQDRKRRRR